MHKSEIIPLTTKNKFYNIFEVGIRTITHIKKESDIQKFQNDIKMFNSELIDIKQEYCSYLDSIIRKDKNAKLEISSLFNGLDLLSKEISNQLYNVKQCVDESFTSISSQSLPSNLFKLNDGKIHTFTIYLLMITGLFSKFSKFFSIKL